jgi:hypothetical protein
VEAIDIQAASSAGVDSEGVVSPSHLEEKERLEKLLKNRSDPKELQEKNILKGERGRGGDGELRNRIHAFLFFSDPRHNCRTCSTSSTDGVAKSSIGR